jgi:hypothetical protein
MDSSEDPERFRHLGWRIRETRLQKNGREENGEELFGTGINCRPFALGASGAGGGSMLVAVHFAPVYADHGANQAESQSRFHSRVAVKLRAAREAWSLRKRRREESLISSASMK